MAKPEGWIVTIQFRWDEDLSRDAEYKKWKRLRRRFLRFAAKNHLDWISTEWST